jgi:hypothetical protein
LLLIGAEISLRANGIKPWPDTRGKPVVTPGGKLTAQHPLLGYSHLPGAYTVTLPSGFSYQATHLPNGLRITHPLETYGRNKLKREIWIFGCSFTYGLALNDSQTYPWLLQEHFPEYEVVNFGVEGYGTVHSAIQLKEALKAANPAAVILAYAGFHDERNTFSRTRRKLFTRWNSLGPLSQPYAWLDAGNSLHFGFGEVWYREFPLAAVSSAALLMDMKYDELEGRFFRSHEVAEALVLYMAELAKTHGAKFFVAGIDRSAAAEQMLKFVRGRGISAIDISVDLKDSENNSGPHDALHPSALAARRYADRLEEFLRRRLQ